MAISLKESINSGFIDFWSRKLRSFVTIFGIILGTMSIMVVQSLVNGMKEESLNWMNERGGANKISIRPNWRYENDNPKLKKYFTFNELQFIREYVTEADHFSASVRLWNRVSFGQTDYYGQVRGVFPDYPKVNEWNVAQGTFFNEYDLDTVSDVIVLGSTVKKELFGSKDPIGKFITFNGRRFMVIGVMERREFYFKNDLDKNNALEHFNQRCFIPLSVCTMKLGNNQINSFDMKFNNLDIVDDVRFKIEDLLLNMRDGKPLFRVQSPLDRLERMQENAKMFQVIFMFIGGISLFVGGIVIMNLMLATIQERTREIGIRLSVGARRMDVFVQFLVQTTIITLIGGFLGVFVGYWSLNIIQGFLKTSMSNNPVMIIWSIAISLGIGFFFGIYPAWRASNLNPVKALQYE